MFQCFPFREMYVITLAKKSIKNSIRFFFSFTHIPLYFHIEHFTAKKCCTVKCEYVIKKHHSLLLLCEKRVQKRRKEEIYYLTSISCVYLKNYCLSGLFFDNEILITTTCSISPSHTCIFPKISFHKLLLLW